MVREILKASDARGREILSTPCEKVNIKEAYEITRDLIDTVNYHNDLYEKGLTEKHCCGLAANQIGINKAVFVYQLPNGKFNTMVNPVITCKSRETIDSLEGCMSMEDETTVKRHTSIDVFYQQPNSAKMIKMKVSGFTAIEIQHEMDHLKGILV